MQFGNLWPSVRVAMLSEQKYGALINNFSSTANIITAELQAEGCRDFIGSSQHSKDSISLHSAEVNVSQPAAHDPRISTDIKCLVFPQGDISRFKPSR